MSTRRIEVVHKLYPVTVGDNCTVIDFVADAGTACVALIEHADDCRCSGLRTTQETMMAELENEDSNRIYYSSSGIAEYLGRSPLPVTPEGGIVL